MFEFAIELMTDFIDLIPVFIPFILVMNLMSSLIWGDR